MAGPPIPKAPQKPRHPIIWLRKWVSNSSLVKKFPQVSKWVAGLGWAGFLLAAVGIQAEHEYGIALACVAASALSITFSVILWEGNANSKFWTVIGRTVGLVSAVLIAAVGCLWIWGQKGDQDWSRIPNYAMRLIHSMTTIQGSGTTKTNGQVDAQTQKAQKFLAEHTLVFVSPLFSPNHGSDSWQFSVPHLGDIKPVHNVQIFGSNHEGAMPDKLLLPPLNVNPEPGNLSHPWGFQMALKPSLVHHLYFEISDEDSTFTQDLWMEAASGLPRVASRLIDKRTMATLLTCKDSGMDKYLDESWRKFDMPECASGQLFRLASLLRTPEGFSWGVPEAGSSFLSEPHSAPPKTSTHSKIPAASPTAPDENPSKENSKYPAPPDDLVAVNAIKVVQSCNSLVAQDMANYKEAGQRIQEHNSRQGLTEISKSAYLDWVMKGYLRDAETQYEQFYRQPFQEAIRSMILEGAKEARPGTDYGKRVGNLLPQCDDLESTTENYINQRYASGKMTLNQAQGYMTELRKITR